MVLWLESDRMGWLLSTVTAEAFDNQKDVVQNEKRQRVDNRPYGHTSYVIDKNLYPEEHPYNWQVIGSLEDIANATVDDIRDFFNQWYGPNNATLVIAGDFDGVQTKEWVEKYFGEIKSSNEVGKPEPRPAALASTKRVFVEDNFARSPELNMVFPTVEQYHADSYPLDLLGDLLADGKKAPFYQVLVEEKKLAPSVRASQNSGEIAGSFGFRVRTFPGKSLSEVEQALNEAMARFEEKSFSEADLDRLKAKTEMNFYESIPSIFTKAFQLASYNEFAGDPGYIGQDLQKYLDVTKEDIIRVYNTYIKDKNFVLTSFVPKGQVELVADNSTKFEVVEEDISKAGRQEETDEKAPVEKIASSFDRSVEPPKGPQPTLNLPGVWRGSLDNGLSVFGIEHHELPLVEFAVLVPGGLLLDNPEKIGVANLITDMLMEGTANKTPVELEEAIDGLGADISMYTTDDAIVLNCRVLKTKFSEALALAEEILLQPRWDEKEFARVKEETIEAINRSNDRPSVVANRVFHKLLYGESNLLAHSALGTPESVETITIDDLKAYYTKNFSPRGAHMGLVGNIKKEEAMAALDSLGSQWQGEAVAMPELTYPAPPEKPALYFVDVPNAKQSEIRVGYLSLAKTDAEYHAAQVMNYKLGGSFNSVLNLILREEKGYTYGARSGFNGTAYRGPFMASSAVRSNATQDSVKIFKEEIRKFANGISEEDLEFTKNALVKSNSRRFETLGALLSMVNDIARYNLSDQYIKDQEKITLGYTVEQHRQMAAKYLPENMVFLVVGDKATQLEPLKSLGLGDPILLDKSGNPVDVGSSSSGQ